MENLIIRRTEPSDAKDLQTLYLGFDVYSQTLQLPLPSIKMWENRINNISNNIYSFVAVIDNEIVGNLGLTHHENPRLRHIAEIGMAVREGFHGQGIGSAFMNTAIDLAENWLNVSRIQLTVYADNEKAINLYKKFGFLIEGEAKNYAFRNGEFVNAYYMARVKD